VTIGILAIFAGYTVASYGVCMLRDYDIPWKAWINPLSPWAWPAGAVPKIPATRLWPA
jgi:hypothetical protein